MKEKNKYLSPELTIDEELYGTAVLCTSSVDGLDIIDGTDVEDVTGQFDI